MSWWWLGGPIILVGAFLAFGHSVANDPANQERFRSERVIAQCQKDLEKLPNNEIVIGACAKLRDDYRRKFGREP